MHGSMPGFMTSNACKSFECAIAYVCAGDEYTGDDRDCRKYDVTSPHRDL